MKAVYCPYCGGRTKRNGRTSSGSQRWRCTDCGASTTVRYDDTAARLDEFLGWLLSKDSQAMMPGGGRSFRRRTAEFWEVWPMPVPDGELHRVLHGDGIWVARDLVVLICCSGESGLATLMWTVPGGARETGGPYMRDPRHPRHFTDEFKRQIVDLYNAGKPKREIMDEYDLGKSTVERWIKSINATGSPRAACNRTPEQNRILELERENRRLRMEVDVLKQAALIYARK